MELLKSNQKAVVKEAIDRKLQSGGLSLPLGFGKTRTSICLGLQYNCGKILVVVSKTLLAGWIQELEKAFGKDFPVEIMHKTYLKKTYGLWKPKEDTKVVLTTHETLSAGYKEYNLDALFINHVIPKTFGPTILQYLTPKSPMLVDHVGAGYLFSIKWGCLIIDEIQTCNNILTDKCRSIACVSSTYRWGLSGTMFDEPKPERFLGYFLMLHIKGANTLPDMRRELKSTFTGFKKYLIARTDNTEFVDRPEYIEEIVTHTLDTNEAKIFEVSREVLKELATIVKQKKREGDVEGRRKFGAYILALITYIRQFVICPIIPIASIYCDIADFSEKSELSKILSEKFKQIKIDKWLDDEESILSSRFKSIVEKIKNHKGERILVFSCFRTTITLFQDILNKQGYTTFTISATHSTDKRKTILEKFAESDGGIMLLPYSVGAEGLNLQCASVVMVMDLWWNCSKIQQAIGRAFRPGQTAPSVHVYMFVSNTQMENELIKKNQLKQEILQELENGPSKKTFPRMSTEKIMDIIGVDINQHYLRSIRT